MSQPSVFDLVSSYMLIADQPQLILRDLTARKDGFAGGAALPSHWPVFEVRCPIKMALDFADNLVVIEFPKVYDDGSGEEFKFTVRLRSTLDGLSITAQVD